MFNIDAQRAEEITKSFQIPPKPEILVQIQDVQAQEDPSPNAFADVITKDVGLSAAVLKTVNSPVFGLKRTVTDIRQSVMLLGNTSVCNLVSFFALKKAFSQDASISYEKYWDSAMETANMMTVLVEHMHLQSVCPLEDAYAYGLFRDCGIPLMAMRFNDYNTVLLEANRNPTEIFTDIEERHYQTNHATIGYFVSSSWHFPLQLCQLIARHHDPDFLNDSSVSDTCKQLYALAKLASNILAQYRSAEDDPEWLLSQESVLSFFRLSDIDYADLEEDVKEHYSVLFG
jgi:HD-like signal output (HDOD) protein